MTIKVRLAKKNDMPAVLRLIQDLSEALNESGPKMTVDDLYEDGGFDGGYPYFFAILAEDSELKDSNELSTTIGIALCHYSYSTDGRIIYLRSFFVQHSYRSKGIGGLIFQELLNHAKENACRRIELHVPDWNTSAQRFYQRAGAINITERDGHAFYRFFKDVINKIDA